MKNLYLKLSFLQTIPFTLSLLLVAHFFFVHLGALFDKLTFFKFAPNPLQNGGILNFTPNGAKSPWISSSSQSLPGMPQHTVKSQSDTDPPP